MRGGYGGDGLGKAGREAGLVLALAFLALTIGPLVDHHFAEREAGHGHIFLALVREAAAPDHVHLYAEPHGHGPTGTPKDGVGIVPAQPDGVAEGLSFLVLVTGAVLVFALGALRPVLSTLPALAGVPSTGPPRRPPRS